MYKPIPPSALKKMLEKRGYELVAQDNSNWIMESKGHVAVICQTMKLVPEDIIESMLGPAEIDEPTFLKLLAEIEPAAARLSATQPSGIP